MILDMIIDIIDMIIDMIIIIDITIDITIDIIDIIFPVPRRDKLRGPTSTANPVTAAPNRQSPKQLQQSQAPPRGGDQFRRVKTVLSEVQRRVLSLSCRCLH